MNARGKIETTRSADVMQSCIGNQRRADLPHVSNHPAPSFFPDEVLVSAAHFSIERLTRLEAKSVDTALAWLGQSSLRNRFTQNGATALARRALFACMVERSLPIPIDLLGIRSLLLIDDEPAVLRSMSRVLRQAAPELILVLAEGAKEGLALALARQPDAVLVDAYMPEMRGPDVCDRIRTGEATRHIPVLAMTADPSPELAHEFARAGALAFLEKPVDAPALFEVLSAHLLPSSAGDS